MISEETDSLDALVEIGVVGRAHGMSGAVHVFLYNADSEILKIADKIVLRDGFGSRTIEVAECRPSAKSKIVRFSGISNRSEAELLKGAVLSVKRCLLPPLNEDEFYVSDLIGIEAWDGNSLIGTITSTRAQVDIEIITVADEKREIEIPLTDDFVVSVDLKSKRINLTDTGLLPESPIGRKSSKK